MTDNFYYYPKQVIYKCKGDENHYAGIAVEDFVISAQTGVVVPLEDLEILKEFYWIDITDSIKGDFTEGDSNFCDEVLDSN
jgi:hypothetical protein